MGEVSPPAVSSRGGWNSEALMISAPTSLDAATRTMHASMTSEMTVATTARNSPHAWEAASYCVASSVKVSGVARRSSQTSSRYRMHASAAL